MARPVAGLSALRKFVLTGMAAPVRQMAARRSATPPKRNVQSRESHPRLKETS